MSKGDTPLKRLQVRKQVLIAEASLQRSQLRADLLAIHSGLQRAGDKAKSLGLIASVAAPALAALTLFRRKPASDNHRRGILSSVLGGVRFATGILRVLRP